MTLPWIIRDGESSRVYLVDDKEGAVGEVVYADFRKPSHARLISASPDMLYALQTLTAAVEHYFKDFEHLHPEISCPLQLAKAALDKATRP
jgi:tripartite-type tricarboxylate transporter receptor subunit TctC